MQNLHTPPPKKHSLRTKNLPIVQLRGARTVGIGSFLHTDHEGLVSEVHSVKSNPHSIYTLV